MNQVPLIGWVGLGKLGLSMAGRLAAAGYAVAGYDRDQSRIAVAAERGLVPAATSQAAAADKDVVFTSLPDDKALRAAVLGETGLLALMRQGSILVETSTVSAEASAAVAQESDARRIAYLRLPVSGNPTLAETGTLTCFASGPSSALEAVQPLLATFTRAQTYLGSSEEARYAKLAVNLMIAVSAGMIAEALALARKGNIAWRDLLEVLAESAVGSPMVKYKVGPLAERDFSSTFSCRQMAKDLDLILRAANSQNVPVPLAALMRETYSSLIAQGDGDNDFIAIVRHVERLSGLAEPA
jgi:3-hydroxyisobutyrate dehydrogenase-like beta-hydroxyacid dehydrogenase